MLSTRKISLAALITITPGVLVAQEFQGVATFGYGQSSASDVGGDLGTFTADAIGNLDFNNGVFWGLDAKYFNADPDDASGNLSLLDLGTTLNYQFAGGGVIGAYVDYADESFDTGLGFDLDTDVTSYGISGG